MPTAADIICLLDDEPCVLKALCRLFASEGLRAEKFSDPFHFLDHARSHPVRLAVIDIHMPGMSGLEVLAELRERSPDVRVIIMTGESDSTYRFAALEGGAYAFFLKPFDDEKFLEVVRQAVAPAA